MKSKTIACLALLIFAGAVAAEPVTSSLKVKLYGKLKADASYDDSRTSVGPYVKWVDDESSTLSSSLYNPTNDAKFNMTARETRIGLDVSGPRIGTADASGKLEFDFYGTDNGGNNKGGLLLRHAYSKLSWAERRTSLLFGQTSDIISPLVPTTLNYTVLWWTGNVGYRRAQVRYSQDFVLGGGSGVAAAAGSSGATVLSVQAGILDNLGSAAYTNTGGNAESPNLQARVGLTFPTGLVAPATVGVAGHIAKEKNDTGSTAQGHEFDSSGLYLDGQLPVTNWLAFKGEFFHGVNLSQFLGGIGQGINTGMTPDREVATTGGWAQACLGPWNRVSVNAGYGVDDPQDTDLGTAGQRLLNQAIFANVLFKASKHLTFGIELSNLLTRYRETAGVGGARHNARANRVQASAIYSFY